MKVCKLLVAAGIVALIVMRLTSGMRGTRSAVPVAYEPWSETSAYDPAESAGLFVGVERFRDNTLEKVAFAVDDAVDLASAFSLEPNTSLMPPSRVILALAGMPRKPESKERLERLRAAGARVVPATCSEILARLHEQARAAGKHGLLIVTLATHGFSNEGTPYLLASSSIYRHHDTSLSASNLLDIAAATGAARSLILVDACRERVTTATRTGPDPASAALFLEAMSKTRGQAVLWAAAAGGYAYDDPKLKNGVFSHAVLRGLRCGAAHDTRGFVTFDTLAEYVEREVRSWILTNRNANIASATQRSVEGAAANMPLVHCGAPAPPPSITSAPANPHSVKSKGGTFEVFGEDGSSLWTGNVAGRIAHADVADLDGDNKNNEVIVGIAAKGQDAGRIIAFDANGHMRWTNDTSGGSSSARFGVTTFLVSPLVHGDRRRQIAAISSNDRQSRLTIIDPEGKTRSMFPYPEGHLRRLELLKATNLSWAKLLVIGRNVRAPMNLGVDGPVQSVLLLNPYKPKLALIWSGVLLPASQTIGKLEIRDCDNDGRRDIAIELSSGARIYVDPDGEVLSTDAGAKFVRIKEAISRRGF